MVVNTASVNTSEPGS